MIVKRWTVRGASACADDSVILGPGQLTAGAGPCDASFFRAVLNTAGEVLDIGRETRRWPTAIRRAITLRDGGCSFPGCDRPPSWCDADRCHEWDHGGPTSLANGVLLCRKHHAFIHTQHWSIQTKPDGRHTFRRPDHSTFHITTIDQQSPELFLSG